MTGHRTRALCFIMKTETIIVQSVPGYNSWPFIQKLGDSLVATYSRGDMHDIHETCRGTYARVSRDGGNTWEDETVVVNTPDFCESAIGRGLDENGALLSWVRCIGPDWQGWHHNLYRSTDGKAFERIATPALSPMPMQITDVMHVPGVGLMSLWFAGNYRDLPENAWGILTSADNGTTWTQTTIEDKLDKFDWPTEQCGLVLNDGRIFVIARSEGIATPDKNFQFQMQSTDGGRTWKKTRTNVGDVYMSTPGLIYTPETDELYLYYYHRGAGLLKCRKTRLADIWDNPLAWPEPVVIAKGATQIADAGNVNVFNDNGIHRCIYYTGNEKQTDIVMTNVDWSRE